MINEYKKESRALIQKALKGTFVRVPAQFRQEFFHYHRHQLFKFFLQVNIVAQLPISLMPSRIGLCCPMWVCSR